MTDEFQRNDLIGLAMLFRLSAKNEQIIAGNVQVLIPVRDCERLAVLLDIESESAENSPSKRRK